MALTDLDRQLISRCLRREPQAWTEFVDRFLGVFHHVIHHVAHMRSVALAPVEVEDLAAEVMAEIVKDEARVLRHFRGRSSLATYLTVVARRVVVHRLAERQELSRLATDQESALPGTETPPEFELENVDEVTRLLSQLDEREASLVRAIYLEHKSYRDASRETGIPENSIGPMLHRLRSRLRKTARA